MQYLDQEIQRIDKSGITMSDGYKICFEECSQTWKDIKNVAESKSVGERDITAATPYFRFYREDDVVEILIRRKGLLKRWRSQTAFLDLQKQIDQLGYVTYDLS